MAIKNTGINVKNIVKPAVMPKNQLSYAYETDGGELRSSGGSGVKLNGSSGGSGGGDGKTTATNYYDTLKEQTDAYYQKQRDDSNSYYQNQKANADAYYNDINDKTNTYYDNINKQNSDYYNGVTDDATNYYNDRNNAAKTYYDNLDSKIAKYNTDQSTAYKTNYDTAKKQTEDYYRNLREQIASYYSGKESDLDSYYQNARNVRYKDLFEQKIGIANANALAQKYAANALIAKGFGSQGLSETAQTNYANAYYNALGNANANYQSDLNTMNQQKAQALTELADSEFANNMTAYQNEQSENRSNLQDYNNLLNNLAQLKFNSELSADQARYNDSTSALTDYQNALSKLKSEQYQNSLTLQEQQLAQELANRQNQYSDNATREQNQYQANLNLAQQKFEQTITNMANEHSENRSDSATYGDNLISSMETFTSVDDLNSYLTSSGLMTNGEIDESKLSELGLSKTQIALIKQAYNTATATLVNNASDISSNGTLVGDDGIKYYYNKDHKAQDDITGWFNDEYKELKGQITRGEITDGTCVKLINGHGDYTYIVYKNGNVYYTTEANYNNASSKKEINTHNYGK